MSERRWWKDQGHNFESVDPASSVAQLPQKGETDMNRNQMVIVVGLVILVVLLVAVYAQRFVG